MTYKDYVKNAKTVAKRTGYAQAVCFDKVFEDVEILHCPTQVLPRHVVLGIADVDYRSGKIVYTEQNL